jgi:hypothetical protein
VQTLDFYQIVYQNEQRKHLYNFSIPYDNNKPTPFLENEVIRSLIPQSKSDLIAVCSWQLKQKRHVIPSKYVLKENAALLSRQRILAHAFDVGILTPRLPGHKTLFMGTHWFGNTWTQALSVLSEFLHSELGVSVPIELTFPIYENHFIATGSLYKEYVASCLDPVMKFMQQESIFFEPSGYLKHQKHKAEFDKIEHYQNALGMNDWIIGVFLLEHLFSIWINNKKVNVIIL